MSFLPQSGFEKNFGSSIPDSDFSPVVELVGWQWRSQIDKWEKGANINK